MKAGLLRWLLCVWCAGFFFLPDARSMAAELTYPSRPIRLISPVAAGGATGLVARLIGTRMGEIMGQNFVVDDRPGAGSIIGSTIVARATPDGYTLLMAYATHITTTFLHDNVGYHPLNDFTPVTLVASQQIVLAINANLPVRSTKELVALAKARPGQLNFSIPSTGSAGHIAAEMFNMRTGINVVGIPYKGGPAAQIGLITNEVQIFFGNVLNGLALVKTEKARLLGIASERRSALLPNVATLAEQGFPALHVEPWQGILGPRGLPPTIVEVLQKAAVRALQDVELREKLESMGSTAIGSTPHEFREQIEGQLRMWGEVITKSGMKARL